LDGIRAFSVIAVVWHHTGMENAPQLLRRGFLGVDMFFVLSGFLIVTLLLREKDRSGSISLRNFYIRRSLRIFPVYYGLLLGLSAVFLVKSSSETGSVWFSELPILLTYTANIFTVTSFMSIAWSLAAEEQFYLVWPTVERASRTVTFAVLGGAILVSQLIHFRAFTALGMPFEHRLPEMLLQTTFTPILFGVVLAHVLHQRRGFDAVNRILGYRMASPIVVVVLVFVLSYAPGDITGVPRLSIHLLMVLLLAASVVREDHALAPLFRWSLLVRIGATSYGIYLFHMMGRHAVRAGLDRAPVLDAPGVFFGLTLLVTWGVAELSFRYFEMPFLKLKKKFQML